MNCKACNKSFEEVGYHCKGMCRTCYNIQWAKANRVSKKRETLDHCVKCLSKWGSTSIKGKPVKEASRGLCKICYNQYYAKVASTICKRCNRDMGKKSKSVCSLCKIELEAMKSPSKRKLPKVDNMAIDKETKETMRRLFNRYKWGTNTLVDPYITLNLYLDVFSNENIKGLSLIHI